MSAALTKSEIVSLLRESVADVRLRSLPPLAFGVGDIDERAADRGLDGAALNEVAPAAAARRALRRLGAARGPFP